MVHGQAIEDMWWIEERLGEIKETTESLRQGSSDYLQWMSCRGYADATQANHRNELRAFAGFIELRRLAWDRIFTMETLNAFREARGTTYAHAVRGLSRYLFENRRIKRPIENIPPPLPEEYEDYLLRQSSLKTHRQTKHIRRVLSSFNGYVQESGISLCALKIDDVDAFLVGFLEGFASGTCRVYRGYLRGFLRYLFYERTMIKRDLASLVKSARVYGRSKPPTFLRPQEVGKLFSNLQLSSPQQIRTYAMVHLAYYLGLRPKEISLIRLDDI